MDAPIALIVAPVLTALEWMLGKFHFVNFGYSPSVGLSSTILFTYWEYLLFLLLSLLLKVVTGFCLAPEFG